MGTEKKDKENSATTGKTAQFSARVKSEDKDFFNEFLSKLPGSKSHEKFSSLCDQLKTGPQVIEKPTELKEGEHIINANDPAFEFLNRYQKPEHTSVMDVLKEAVSRLKHLEENPTVVEKSVTVETERKLADNQLVITFNKQTIDNIRKARPWIKKKELFEYTKGDDTDFMNQLINFSSNKILRIYFDNIINPL